MDAKDLRFTVTDEVLRAGVRGIYFVLDGVRNRPSDACPEFERIKADTTADVLAGLSPEVIEQDQVLQGFRRVHEAVNCANRKNVAAPENLLRLLLKDRQSPMINLLVDIYNLVSVRTRLALGAHDLAKVTGDIQLRLTDGSENFWPIGAPGPKPVRPGEYCYVDAANDVICRLEVRQVEKTKVTLNTAACFYIVQGNAATPPEYLRSAAEELLMLTKRFCGGQERFLYPV